MKNNIVIEGSTTCRGFVEDNLEFKIAVTIAALEDFKQCGVNVIEDKECGLCYNMRMITGYTTVGVIADRCSGGYPVYDESDESDIGDATDQYLHYGWRGRLYEGRQLELRKEFAQLCIDYLKESIRI